MQEKREDKSVRSRNVLSFLVKFLLTQKRGCYAVKFVLSTSEVKFAVLRRRRNFTIRRITSLNVVKLHLPTRANLVSVFSVKDDTHMRLFLNIFCFGYAKIQSASFMERFSLPFSSLPRYLTRTVSPSATASSTFSVLCF